MAWYEYESGSKYPEIPRDPGEESAGLAAVLWFISVGSFIAAVLFAVFRMSEVAWWSLGVSAVSGAIVHFLIPSPQSPPRNRK